MYFQLAIILVMRNMGSIVHQVVKRLFAYYDDLDLENYAVK